MTAVVPCDIGCPSHHLQRSQPEDTQLGGQQRKENNNSSDYSSMSICMQCVSVCTVHTASTCAVLHYRTSADGWLVLIHGRGTNLSRQLDSLTDLTTDNPAGSFSCNNPGEGGYFVWELSAWDTIPPHPSSPAQSQRAGNNHRIKVRPKSRESQIKWCVSSVLIRSALSVGRTNSTSAHSRQSSVASVCASQFACKSVGMKDKLQTPMCHPYVTGFQWMRMKVWRLLQGQDIQDIHTVCVTAGCPITSQPTATMTLAKVTSDAMVMRRGQASSSSPSWESSFFETGSRQRYHLNTHYTL